MNDPNDWDREFITSLDADTTISLTNAANYLDIPKLLDLCCKSLANMIKGKSVDEVKEFFGIE